MCAETEWLDNLVQQIRLEAEKLGLSQEEVVARLRAGETVEGLFPALADACRGRTSAYLVWELQTHSWAGTTWSARHAKIHAWVVGRGEGKRFSGILPKQGTE